MKRNVLIVIVIVLLAIAGWQGYTFLYKAPEHLSTIQAFTTISANELLQAFEKDSMAANKLYLGKVIEVTGTVKTVEEDEDLTIILQTSNALSSVRCSMDSTQRKVAASIKPGRDITIKGNCTGFTFDELLGADVILNRCVLIEKKNK